MFYFKWHEVHQKHFSTFGFDQSVHDGFMSWLWLCCFLAVNFLCSSLFLFFVVLSSILMWHSWPHDLVFHQFLLILHRFVSVVSVALTVVEDLKCVLVVAFMANQAKLTHISLGFPHSVITAWKCCLSRLKTDSQDTDTLTDHMSALLFSGLS